MANWNSGSALTLKASFSFNATDLAGNVSNTAIVSVTVKPVNDYPVALRVLKTTSEDTPVTFQLSATDVDGDAGKRRPDFYRIRRDGID